MQSRDWADPEIACRCHEDLNYQRQCRHRFAESPAMSSMPAELEAASPRQASAQRSATRTIAGPGHQQGLALGVAAATLAMMMWGLGRPALWLDESASVVATQRTWAGLWALLGGADAPLVPYYALLKTTSSAVTAIAPGSVESPELLFRWPSVAVTVLAAWALTLWLARRCHPGLAITTAALLLATGALSRYAQEARPYAFVLAAAVVATILWTRLTQDRRRRWVGLYALTVALLVAAHLFAASLVFAHLVAAVVTAERQDRRWAVLRTCVGAALGLLMVSPVAVTAGLQGRGPNRTGSLPFSVPSVLVDTLTVGGVLALGLGVTSALAVGVAWVARHRYRYIARLAVAWAVVPLVVLFPLVLLRPNLLRSRYVLFVLPGWVILGALGIWILLDLVGRALARLADRTGSNGGPLRRLLVGAATYSVGVLIVAGFVASQLDTLRSIRTAAGHGEDIRPALAAANRGEHVGLPIVVWTPNNSLAIAAYARADEHRLAGARVQRDQPSIWPTVEPLTSRNQELRQPERVVLLLKGSRSGACRWSPRRSPAAHVNRCLPKHLRGSGYQVESVEGGGRSWIFAVLRGQTPRA